MRNRRSSKLCTTWLTAGDTTSFFLTVIGHVTNKHEFTTRMDESQPDPTAPELSQHKPSRNVLVHRVRCTVLLSTVHVRYVQYEQVPYSTYCTYGTRTSTFLEGLLFTVVINACSLYGESKWPF